MTHMKISLDGPVLSIAFDRPEKKNALTGDMYLAAAKALRRADSDDAIGAVVFCGEGGCFTAGNDIADFLAGRREPEEVPAFDFIRALAASKTPLVAAIEGLAIGIGATLTLHCDLVYAAPGTMFRMPFVDLGLVPEAAASLLLPRRVGMAKAAELLLLGEAFDAGEAVRLGLVNAIAPAGDLRALAVMQARRLAAKPREALIETRRLMRGDGQTILDRIDEEARSFARALQSEEARAAFARFLAKSQGG